MDKSIHYRISLYPHFVHVLQNAENITRPLSEAVLHISTIRCSAVTNGNDIVCIVFLIQKRDGRGSVFVVRIIQTPTEKRFDCAERHPDYLLFVWIKAP